MDIFDMIFNQKFYLPIIITCFAIVVNSLLKKVIKKVFSIKLIKMNKNSYNYKKGETICILVQNIVKYLIMVFWLLSILVVFGVDVTSILAGLGIVGTLMGLALQDTVKDLLSGMSILLENQFSVGDYVEITGFKGTVISLGLRTTKIKNYEGAVKIVSNRNITEVINYNEEDSLAIFDISISYESNITEVEEILNIFVDDMNKRLPKLRGKVELLGVQDFSDRAIVYRVVAPVVSMEHFGVLRIMRKELKILFDKNKIKIPYPHVEVVNGK